jgi:uncharacterized YccA/Bax inhibitor family protein
MLSAYCTIDCMHHCHAALLAALPGSLAVFSLVSIFIAAFQFLIDVSVHQKCPCCIQVEFCANN